MRLIAPQAGEARRGAQLERPCSLTTRDLEGPPQQSLGLPVACNLALEQYLALEPVEIGIPQALLRMNSDGERRFDGSGRLTELTGCAVDFCQQCDGHRRCHPTSSGSGKRHPRHAELSYRLLLSTGEAWIADGAQPSTVNRRMAALRRAPRIGTKLDLVPKHVEVPQYPENDPR